MDEGIAEAVAGWDERPFSGGYRGLRELADREFSGAVEAAGCWLLLINGRVVGVYEEREGPDGPRQEPADLERVEDASGTAYEAPYDALPLLFAMQASGGEVVSRNSTGDRPLEEIHRELEREGFTGYLVLSEHVLSGEYYVVYQGGRSMSVAFIGGSRRLKTDDEALERAKKEVGIYEARAVRLEVFDVPEPTNDADAGGGAAGTPDEEATPGADESPDDPHDAHDDDPTPAESELTEPATGADAEPARASDPDDDPLVEETDSDDGAETETSPATGPADDAGDDGERTADQPAATEEPPETDPSPAVTEVDEEEWPPGRDGGASEATAVDPDSESEPTEPADATEPDSTPDAAAVTQLEARLDELAETQSELAATVDRLRTRLNEVVGGGDEAFTPAERCSPAEALAETTLLIRYRSGGETTLARVHEGSGDRDALTSNLQLERVTPFDADETAVDGRRYEAFLQDTVAYRFVEWLVTAFPFEVQSTGTENDLAALYDALPELDRATFDQPATEEGAQFDVVLRNKEGDPLAVAMVDEGTGPPTRETTEAFIRQARDTESETGTLAAAFLVTTGYVDENALGPARDATRTGMLSRSRRKSYVNLSSGGFHLCLVEASGESFHLAVPDL